MKKLSLVCLLMLTFTTAAIGQPTTTAPATQPAGGEVVDAKGPITTRHTMTVGGRELSYFATAGFLSLKEESGKPRANVFFVAYTLDRGPEPSPADRPITFLFNGGPGAAAVWLHLGTAGPRRLALGPEGETPAPPVKLVDNESTWLTGSDLVFIDPVGTGYSRAASPEQAKDFYGVHEDIASIGDFIRLYLTRYQRWGSPKFLAGESYGTLRAAGLAEHLADNQGVAINGVILISSVLSFQAFQFGEGNDLPYINYLPSYAAVAWYHKKLPAKLQEDLGKTLDEVTRFATGEYAMALIKGSSLTAEERRAVAQRLATYTGLPPAYVEKSNLRVTQPAFAKALLEEKGLVVGRFDGRITGVDPEPTSAHAEYDPSLTPYLDAYTATFVDYVRRELRFESELKYDVLSGNVRGWNFGQGNNGYLTMTDNLRRAMAANTHLKVMSASGYFDLAAPYYGTVYSLNHLGLPAETLGNITQRFYRGGHMMYHRKADLEQLQRDVVGFVNGAVGR